MICRQGCEASVKDLESLMSLLAEKKSKMEQEEAETNLQILLDFMLCLRKKKLDELNEVIRLDSFVSWIGYSILLPRIRSFLCNAQYLKIFIYYELGYYTFSNG